MKASTAVALVNMPFAAPERPSIGLGILKSLLLDAGFSASYMDFNLEYLDYIARSAFEYVAYGISDPYDLAGEWVFSGEVSNVDDERFLSHLRNVRANYNVDQFIEQLIAARE